MNDQESVHFKRTEPRESLPFLKKQFLAGSLSLADSSLKLCLVEVAHTIRMNGDDIECVAAQPVWLNGFIQKRLSTCGHKNLGAA